MRENEEPVIYRIENTELDKLTSEIHNAGGCLFVALVLCALGMFAIASALVGLG